MQALNLQTDGIVVYRNRIRVLLTTGLMVLSWLVIGSMDVFALWAFWTHYDIDTGAYVAASLLPIATAFMGWSIFFTLHVLCQRGPVMVINAQGISFSLPLRFTLVPSSEPSFLPWEEIEWIASVRAGLFPWFCLSFKDPAHYWSLSGKGPFRTWRRDALTRAHINSSPFSFSSSARQLLQLIEEHYHSELVRYDIQVRY